MLAVFAILTAIGALAAWRASPLYSLKSTLKLGLIMLLTPAAAIGVVTILSSTPMQRFPALQIALGLVAFLIVVTGSMILTVRVTDAHVAQLPSSVKLVTLHRHRLARWAWFFAVFLLIAACTALALPASRQWLPEIIGGFVLIIFGPMLALLYMMARRNDRGLTSIMTNPWVHWHYDEQQWQAWAENQLKVEQAEQKPITWRKACLFILICGGLLAIGPALNGGPTPENIRIYLGLYAFVGLFMLAVGIELRTAPARHHHKQIAAIPEAYFGDEGVFCNGEYLAWTMSGKYLIAAATERNGQTVAVLTFESFSGNTSVKLHKRVLVPSDRTGDLATLQQKLGARCSTAQIALA